MEVSDAVTRGRNPVGIIASHGARQRHRHHVGSGGMDIGAFNSVGLVALSFLNAMGLVTIAPINSMGFVAIGGVNAMGVVAIGG